MLRELHQLQQAVTPHLRPSLLQSNAIRYRNLVCCLGVQLRLLRVRGGRVLELGLGLLRLLVLRLLGLVLRRWCGSRCLCRCLLSAGWRGGASLGLGLRGLGVLLAGMLLTLARGLCLHARSCDLRLLGLEVLQLLRRHLHVLTGIVALNEVWILSLGLGLVVLHGHMLCHQRLSVGMPLLHKLARVLLSAMPMMMILPDLRASFASWQPSERHSWVAWACPWACR